HPSLSSGRACSMELSSARWRSTTPIAPSVHFNRHEGTMPDKFPHPRRGISTLSYDAARPSRNFTMSAPDAPPPLKSSAGAQKLWLVFAGLMLALVLAAL